MEKKSSGSSVVLPVTSSVGLHKLRPPVASVFLVLIQLLATPYSQETSLPYLAPM